jgi:hypothetical protein
MPRAKSISLDNVKAVDPENVEASWKGPPPVCNRDQPVQTRPLRSATSLLLPFSLSPTALAANVLGGKRRILVALSSPCGIVTAMTDCTAAPAKSEKCEHSSTQQEPAPVEASRPCSRQSTSQAGGRACVGVHDDAVQQLALVT